jgi:hypothetical protein
LITVGFLIRVQGLEMARIVPPFRSKFRMGKMISREGKDSSRKGPLEVFSGGRGRHEERNEKDPRYCRQCESDAKRSQ